MGTTAARYDKIGYFFIHSLFIVCLQFIHKKPLQYMAMCVILVSFQGGRERNLRSKPGTGTNGNGSQLEN